MLVLFLLTQGDIAAPHIELPFEIADHTTQHRARVNANPANEIKQGEIPNPWGQVLFWALPAVTLLAQIPFAYYLMPNPRQNLPHVQVDASLLANPSAGES